MTDADFTDWMDAEEIVYEDEIPTGDTFADPEHARTKGLIQRALMLGSFLYVSNVETATRPRGSGDGDETSR